MHRTPDPMVPRPVEVTAVETEIPGTATLTLAADENWRAHGAAPGQFNMLYAFGVGEAAISLSGNCFDRSRVVHTVRAAGATSQALVNVQPGDMLGLRGPFGRGWPSEALDGKDILIIAGGLGLAPLSPLIEETLARKSSLGIITVIIGARSPDQMLFMDRFEAWGDLGADVLPTVDVAQDGWSGNVGLVTSVLSQAHFDPSKTVAFVCGPEIMMRVAADELVDRGFNADAIWLSLERNMKCAIGHCGHCQFGGDFICKDGPVFCYSDIRQRLFVREL